MVVLRAAANARVERGERVEVAQVPTDEGRVDILVQTRYEDRGFEEQVPRELWVEVRGEAKNLDSAISAFSAPVNWISNTLAFAANAHVDLTQVHLAFDETAGRKEHEFFQAFFPDESGLPRQGRRVKPGLFVTVLESLVGHPEWARLNRAIGHYNLALGHWYYGGESLAVSHLIMAAEALKKAIVREVCRSEGKREQDLFLEHAPELADALRRSPMQIRQMSQENLLRMPWRRPLENWYRRKVIFQGDEVTHRDAMAASDGLEHGFMELSDVHQKAQATAEQTFRYLRESVLRVARIVGEARRSLLELEPLDVLSFRKVTRGKLVGPADSLAPPGQSYPILKWTSKVKGLSQRGDGCLSPTFEERFTVQCGDGVGFSGHSLEIWGRKTREGPPIRAEAKITYGHASRDRDSSLFLTNDPGASPWAEGIGRLALNIGAFQILARAWCSRLAIDLGPADESIEELALLLSRLIERRDLPDGRQDQLANSWKEVASLARLSAELTLGPLLFKRKDSQELPQQEALIPDLGNPSANPRVVRLQQVKDAIDKAVEVAQTLETALKELPEAPEHAP